MVKGFLQAKRNAALAVILSVSLLPSVVNAHEGATGIVKERMDAMKEMGDSMKIMGDMVKGKRPFERQAFVDGASIVSKNSPQIPDLFPQGSDGHKSDALPEIWQQWSQFENKAQGTLDEAKKLQRVLDNGGDEKALKKQFVMLGKSCKSCHTDFRKKKKK